MHLVSITLENFRCFSEATSIPIDSLTTLIGQNDVGKSAILEALEIYFNSETVKMEQNDCCVYTDSDIVQITCEFSNIPIELTLDAGAKTTLEDEYLLAESGNLKIQKIYDCSKTKCPEEIYVIAQHPTAVGVDNLLELKERELQGIIKNKYLDVSLKGNPGMRQAIWNSVPDLQLDERPIPIKQFQGDCKQIWSQLEGHLPLFALFQSDRRSQDSDGEVQNPMKAAVTAAIADARQEIEVIEKKIGSQIQEIVNNTHEAIKTLAPNLASELNPKVNPPTPAKWNSLYSIEMNTNHGIALNKRGSGIRRLVLVGFFKAESERKLKNAKQRSLIYAIEEPETAQHPKNQFVLIKAFKELSNNPGCQVLLSTHSPGLVAELPAEGIRYVCANENCPSIKIGPEVFEEVANALGLIPDSRVKILMCFEGPTDVTAIKCLSRALHLTDPAIPDLSTECRVAFITLGGSTLKHWVAEHYLKGLGKPEVHIYDSDVAKYQSAVDEVNGRNDGSWAVTTNKYEIESYLHKDAIEEAFGVTIEVTDHPNADGHATPKVFAIAYSKNKGLDSVLGESKAKNKLCEKAFPLMTTARIRERDPNGEVEGWLRKVAEMLEK